MKARAVVLAAIALIGGYLLYLQSDAYRRGNRLFYREGRPNRLGRAVGRLSAQLYGAGVGPSFLVALETTGHRSGRPHVIPVVLADHAGERYVVSMFGERSPWVRNVRAAGGRAFVRHGPRREVHLVELPSGARGPVLKAFVGRAIDARPHIPVPPDAPVEAFDRIAAMYPVFRIDPAETRHEEATTMTEPMTTAANRPAWVDLATSDPAAARDFYAQLFGWQIDVNPDPQYGGYAVARVAGQDAAGIGGTQSPDEPSAWSFYIGTADVDRLAEQVRAAGGTVVAPPFDVGGQGRMAVFNDPIGAFISGWQAAATRGFQTSGPNAFSWAELNARGLETAIPFYRDVFGWTTRRSPMPGGEEYVEFLVDGESVAGSAEMTRGLPEGTPSHWLVYFGVDDVDAAVRRVVDLGGRTIVEAQDFPGGRFAVVSDPQGVRFGLLKTEPV